MRPRSPSTNDPPRKSLPQETTRVTPALLSNGGDILRDAIAYQREQVANMIDQASGRRDIEVEEVRERHRSQRHQDTVFFARDALLALIGAGFPMAVELSRIWTSRMAHAIPEFKTAQQAMAYLGLTLNEVQLRALFTTDDSIAGRRSGARGAARHAQRARGRAA